MKVLVSYGRRTHEVETEPDSTVQSLKHTIGTLTTVSPNGKRLICKGRTLMDHESLAQAGLADRSKVLLMASDKASQTQGQLAAAAVAAAQAKAVARKQQLQGRSAPKASTSQEEPTEEERSRVWAKTGIAVLRDLSLQELPPAVLQVAPAIHALDCGGNSLTSIPDQATAFTRLRRLRLSHNEITSASALVPASLTKLEYLLLDHNRLTILPDSFFTTVLWLDTLDLSHNAFTSLPASLGQLGKLRFLHLQHNKLESLPSQLVKCSCLQLLNASQNCLRELPGCWNGNLRCLTALLLDDNRLESFPPTMLKECLRLSHISLHSNPITLEVLRETDGFQDYDERRSAHSNKQIDMRILNPSFDQGADQTAWNRWLGSHRQ